jgi:hypothetical protein
MKRDRAVQAEGLRKIRLCRRSRVFSLFKVELGLGQRHLRESHIERRPHRAFRKRKNLPQRHIARVHGRASRIQHRARRQSLEIRLLHLKKHLLPDCIGGARFRARAQTCALGQIARLSEVGNQLTQCDAGSETRIKAGGLNRARGENRAVLRLDAGNFTAQCGQFCGTDFFHHRLRRLG